MKQRGIYIAAAIAIALMVVVAMHPRYRQHRLMSQLERAPSAEEKARLILEVIDLDADSADEYLEQYAQHDPTVAYDPRHIVGLISDTTSGDVYEVGDGVAGSFRIGTPVHKFQEVQLLRSTERVARFVLQEREGLATPRYSTFRFKYDGGAMGARIFDDVRPEDITHWKTEGIWPF